MSVSPIYERITRDLQTRREKDLFRSIPSFSSRSDMIDCSTNSYLALQNNRSIKKQAEQLSDSTYSGNLASRLVAQYSPLFTELESEIASWKGTETALVFNSGYSANLGIIQALCTRDTEVFSDRLNHASIHDGIRLSGCKLTRYKHVDMHDLENRLTASASTEKIIITDSIFSMDGDRAPLADVVSLAQSYNCLIIIDEAHATGVCGNQGGGLAEELGITQQIDIVMGTMSKALAGCGGYVAVSSLLRDYFVNNSRSLIYSTALPHVTLAHDIAAIRYVRSHPEEGMHLQELSREFRIMCQSSTFSCGTSTTQIIPLITGDERKALSLKAHLAKNDITAPAIRPPTVPSGSARVRLSLHNALNSSDIEHIITTLTSWDGA